MQPTSRSSKTLFEEQFNPSPAEQSNLVKNQPLDSISNTFEDADSEFVSHPEKTIEFFPPPKASYMEKDVGDQGYSLKTKSILNLLEG